MRERFGAKDERSWKLRFHQTAGVSLTAQQPCNVVRTALGALCRARQDELAAHEFTGRGVVAADGQAATLALGPGRFSRTSGVTNGGSTRRLVSSSSG
jgi:methylmalonyl-CoA mutase N-terminal domain/subunit